MRRALLVILATGMTLTACSQTGIGHGPSISPPPASSSPSVPAAPAPSPTEGPASPLTSGVASVTLSGDVALTVSFAPLEEPAVWAPPPAPMDLTWLGAGPQELRLAGTSFLSRAQTSADRSLSFTVRGSDGAIEFTSSTGECSVTITPALPDNVGGVFSCPSITDVEGTVTVDARGVFSATG
jgi:hypothetical protein